MRPLLTIWVVLLALLAIHPFLTRHRVGYERWDTLPYENVNDESYYLATIRHAMHHADPPGDFVIYESRNIHQPRVIYSEWLLGRLLSPFHPQVHHVYWFNHFALPLVLAGLIFAFWRTLGVRPWPAALAALLTLTLVYNMYLYRAVHPRLTGSLFWLHLWMMARFWRQPSWQRTWPVLLTSGLQFYGYPFYWAFHLVSAGVMGLGALRHRDSPRAWRLTLIVLGSLPLAWWAIDAYRGFNSHPAATDLFFRMGYDDDSAIFSKTLVLWMLMSFFWWRAPKEIRGWFLAMGVAGWICINQQVITGKHPSESRYLWFIIQPLMMGQLVAMLDGFQWPQIRQRPAWILAALIGCGSFAWNTHKYFDKPEIYRVMRLEANRGRRVAEWLKTKLPGRQVIAAPMDIAHNIVAHTDHWVYASRYANTHLLKQAEWTRRLHAQDWLTGMSPETYDELLDSMTSPRVATHYNARFHRRYGNYDNVPHSVRDELHDKYTRYVADQAQGFNPAYRCDALLLRPGHRREEQLNVRFKLTQQRDGFELWLRRPQDR